MEWEHYKENIKPKREGRDISQISATPKSKAQLAVIQDKQADFEREINNYVGDDELEVWVRYIRFMEESFPESDFRSKIMSIQGRLIEKFKGEEKYKQDKRLLTVILDLATFSKEPKSVFGYCFYHKLCTHYPTFWQRWILTWIFIRRYDKALKICKESLKRFLTPPKDLINLKVEILKLIDAEDQAAVVEDKHERAVGSLIRENYKQKSLPGPKVAPQKTNKAFSILTDKNTEHCDVMPVCSTNVSEVKDRTKENLHSRQRWKGTKIQCQATMPDADSAFSIFEDNPRVLNENPKFSVPTSALKVKKCTGGKSSDAPITTLNPTTNIVQTCAYSKSKVYPNDNEEWSFEELEAQRRYRLKLRAEQSTSSNESKRSAKDVSDETEDERSCKKHCSISLNSTKSVNSNTLPTKINFELTEISSSTKKISPEDCCKSDNECIMKPKFDDSCNNRPLLNISARNDKSGIVDENILEGIDVSSKAFKEGIGIDNLEKEQLTETPALSKDNKAKVFSVFSEKKNKTPQLLDHAENDNPHSSRQLFDIFSDSSDSKDKPSEPSNFDLEQLENVGRASDAFDIFENSRKRDRTKEESYSLQTLSMNSSTQATNLSHSYVPCTVDKMANRPDTQKINKQMWKILNDCSKVSEPEETCNTKAEGFVIFEDEKQNVSEPCKKDKHERKVKFSDGDSIAGVGSEANSKLSDDSESTIPTTKVDQDFDFEDSSQIKFEVFNDNFAKHNTQDGKINSESLRVTNKTLTPILEGSHEYDSSSSTFLSSKDPSESYKIRNTNLTTISETSVNSTSPDEVHKNANDTQDDKLDSGIYDSPRNCGKQLTPILEGSRESDSSSSSSISKKSSFETCKSAGLNLTTIPEAKPDYTYFNKPTNLIPNLTTAEVTITDLQKLSSPSMVIPLHDEKSYGKENDVTVNFISGEEHERRKTEILKPDRTARDFHLEVKHLTRVPESRTITTSVTDPFDEKLIISLIRSLDPPLFLRKGFVQLEEEEIKIGKVVTLGQTHLKDVTKVGEGAFAKVYKATSTFQDHESEIAIKVQSPPAPWEFYILSEIRSRISSNSICNHIIDMILPQQKIYIYKNSSILLTEYFSDGSLLDMINEYRTANKRISKTIICTYALDMLRCIDALHRAHIIHGDIKPDNWLLRDKEYTQSSISSSCTKCLVLIDFGRSIDMDLLPPSSEFTVSCQTELFECVEMKTGRPWTYQTDFYGVLSCIHILMHNEYMRVYQDKSTGLWKPIKTPPRCVDRTIFSKLFSDLLNIGSCSKLPSLDAHINSLENYLMTLDKSVQYSDIVEHYSILNSK